jgi:cytochrome c oxidase cbb3-type subunit III
MNGEIARVDNGSSQSMVCLFPYAKLAAGCRYWVATLTIFCGALFVPSLSSQERSTQPGSGKSVEVGRKLFNAICAACHGLDGRGSERAPNIATAAKARQLSDEQITGIVSDGIPGTGMPGFHSLGKPGILAVVGYTRMLQHRVRPVALPGNAQQGRLIFFGTAGCSTCHTVAGSGGFLASDLSAYAAAHTLDEIRSAITKPVAPDSWKGTVTAITHDGKEYKGIVRNEDNFSLQLQSTDGGFHLFLKSDLERIDRDPKSVMPADYASRLTQEQLDNLVSYMVSVAQTAKPRNRASNQD